MIVFRVCALGDAVLTVPLLRALADDAPPLVIAHGEHLALWREGGVTCVGLDAEAPGLHRLWAAAEHDEVARALPGALRERLAQGDEVLLISADGPDVAVAAEHLRSLGARRVERRDPRPPPGVHVSDHLCAASGAARAADPRLVFARSPGSDARPGLRVALHPGAGGAHKRWPARRWAAATAAFAAEVRLSLVCGPADEQACAEFVAERDAPVLRPADACALAAGLADCDAVLGHDSGVCHLAAAVGTPTCALFGPTDATGWAPRGPEVRVLRAGPFPTPLEALSVAAVQAELQPWLAGLQASGSSR